MPDALTPTRETDDRRSLARGAVDPRPARRPRAEGLGMSVCVGSDRWHPGRRRHPSRRPCALSVAGVALAIVPGRDRRHRDMQRKRGGGVEKFSTWFKTGPLAKFSRAKLRQKICGKSRASASPEPVECVLMPQSGLSRQSPILGAEVTLQSLPKRERGVRKRIPSRYY